MQCGSPQGAPLESRAREVGGDYEAAGLGRAGKPGHKLESGSEGTSKRYPVQYHQPHQVTYQMKSVFCYLDEVEREMEFILL